MPKVLSGKPAYATPGVNFNTTVLGRGTVSGFVFGKPTTATVTRKVTFRTKAGVFRKTVKFKVPSIDMAIDCTNGCDTAFQQATVPPGGSSGWHTHPGATFVGIGQGEITYDHVIGGSCHSDKFSAGSGFGQMPTEVHKRPQRKLGNSRDLHDVRPAGGHAEQRHQDRPAAADRLPLTPTALRQPSPGSQPLRARTCRPSRGH